MRTEADAWRAWGDAAAQSAVGDALHDLYARLAADIVQRSPTCWVSGMCCKFETYGHRLYVTALEIAWMVRRLDDAARARLMAADLPTLDGCPFQVAKLCSIHALRPLGCRIFYCDPNAQQWQNPVYEQFLSELRELHDRHAIAYRYIEWRTGLADARRFLTAAL